MELPCICAGNWRQIVHECEPLIGRIFLGPWRHRRHWRFFGIVNGWDDYYYGMIGSGTHGLRLLSCVGSIDGFGFRVQELPFGWVDNPSYKHHAKPFDSLLEEHLKRDRDIKGVNNGR